jgi:hypothetical protein
VRGLDASRNEPLHVLDVLSLEHLEGVRVCADEAKTLDVVHAHPLPKGRSVLYTCGIIP